MRTRAFRPQVDGCLEDRAMLSGHAGLSPNPVVLPHRKLAKAAELIHAGFQFYAQDREFAGLRNEILKGIVMIPFSRAENLGPTIDEILDRMQHELSDRVPHAMRAARRDVLAATFAVVETRVQAGDVIVVR